MRLPCRPGLSKCNQTSPCLSNSTVSFSTTLKPKGEEKNNVALQPRWVTLRRETKSDRVSRMQKYLWPYSGKKRKSSELLHVWHSTGGVKRYVHTTAVLNPSAGTPIKYFRDTISTARKSNRDDKPSIFDAISSRQLSSINLKDCFEAAFLKMAFLDRAPSFIQFLSTPTADTPGTALRLVFDDKRYIFGNAHEGISRATMQLGKKLAKVSDIFISGKIEWRNIGGLLGTILFIADSTASAAASAVLEAEQRAVKLARCDVKYEQPFNRNIEREHQKQENLSAGKEIRTVAEDEKATLTIHGGPNITHALATARRFIFRKGMPVIVDESSGSTRRNASDIEWTPDWIDERIKVWYLPISPTMSDETNLHPNSESPLKRRFSELATEEQTILTDTSIEDQELRKSVISHMFDSPWRLDSLEEIPLSEVQMPATIFVRSKTTKSIEPYLGPLPDGTNILPQINVLVRKAWPGALVSTLPPAQQSKVAMSYIIRNHPQRGRFQPEKAKALNVPPGKLYGELTNGRNVKSADGQTVTPEMVLGKGIEGNGAAVIDLPATEYVHNLVIRPEWHISKIMNGVEVIIWILGPGVGQNAELQKFMNDNHHLKHIISSQDHCPNNLAFDSSASAATRLHQIDPSHFPIPIHNNVVPQSDQPNGQIVSSNFINAQRGLKVQLHPEISVQNDEVIPVLDTTAVLNDTPEDVLRLAHDAKENILSESAQQEMADQNLPSPDAEIICLGTGSALPSKYRNVSATLLRVPGSGSYLLDCGENTLGQLKRIYGPVELGEVLRDLKLIWISHLHADHHLGITAVIKAWNREVCGEPALSLKSRDTSFQKFMDPARYLNHEQRLFVVSSSHMINWLREYSSVEDYGYNHTIPLSSSTFAGSRDMKLDWDGIGIGFDPKFGETAEALKKATGLTDLKFCYVQHCKFAQAVSLTFPSGFKFSYSGDCRPSKRFVEIGQGSTVLLHEATFDDELKGDAIAKKHSTTSEAIGVGIAMGAQRILLTHFSQRYQKIPMMDGLENLDVKLEDSSNLDNTPEGFDNVEPLAIPPTDTAPHKTSPEPENSPPATHSLDQNQPTTPPLPSLQTPPPRPKDLKIGVAFDYMRVKVRDIIHLEKYVPALLKLYDKADLDDARPVHHRDTVVVKGKAVPRTTKAQRKAELKARRGGARGEREGLERDGIGREESEKGDGNLGA